VRCSFDQLGTIRCSLHVAPLLGTQHLRQPCAAPRYPSTICLYSNLVMLNVVQHCQVVSSSRCQHQEGWCVHNHSRLWRGLATASASPRSVRRPSVLERAAPTSSCSANRKWGHHRAVLSHTGECVTFVAIVWEDLLGSSIRQSLFRLHDGGWCPVNTLVGDRCIFLSKALRCVRSSVGQQCAHAHVVTAC
jgi:hypothetical protein